MDNLKTGSLIRELRKEHSLTQKELAEKLHITDRAVSKWERGVCAPDIALLEPLANILNVTVTELISGERNPPLENADTPLVPKTETAVREAISYSRAEMRQKRKLSRKRIFLSALAVTITAAVFIFAFWYKGGFHVVGRFPSPDGSTVTTVYSCQLGRNDPPRSGGFTLSDDGYYRGRSIYTNAEFRDCWWSPDGSYQVVSMYAWGEHWYGEKETVLVLTDFIRNKGTNLENRLENALYQNDFFTSVPYDADSAHYRIEFEFIQWSQFDPAKMLIYFSYTDTTGQFREGYLWYDYESGKSYGEMEIEQGDKHSNPLNDLLKR